MDSVVLRDLNRMVYSRVGHGNTNVIMIHGWGLTHKVWDRLASEMNNGEYSLYLLDLVGFGDSDKRRNHHSIASWGRDIIEFAEKTEIDEPIIFGHSLGASVTLKVLITQSVIVRGAVIFDSGYKSAGNVNYLIEKIEKGVSEKEIRHLISSFFGQIKDDDLAEFTNKALRIDQRTMVSSLKAISRFNFCRVIHSIDVPTLVFYGDNDNNRKIVEVESLSSLLPRGFLRIVLGSGHCPMYEKPKEVARTLSDFMRIIQ